jgi:hypothetical protein
MYAEFKAMAQGRVDYTLDAFAVTTDEYGVMMAIATEDSVIYVTKEQAMKFFDLKPNT